MNPLLTDAGAVHLRSTRSNELYRVLAYDPATKLATLKGQLGQCTEPFERARLEELGYVRIDGPVEGMIEV
jgi:hypothetical protein